MTKVLWVFESLSISILLVLLYILYCHSWKGPMWVEMHWIWTLINYNMKILQVAFLLLFNYLDSLPKLYSLISPWVQQTLQFTPLALELSLLYGLISSRENSAHFLQLMPFTIIQFFVPPCTHHSWVGRDSMEWEVCPTPLHKTRSGNRAPDLLI